MNKFFCRYKERKGRLKRQNQSLSYAKWFYKLSGCYEKNPGVLILKSGKLLSNYSCLCCFLFSNFLSEDVLENLVNFITWLLSEDKIKSWKRSKLPPWTPWHPCLQSCTNGEKPVSWTWQKTGLWTSWMPLVWQYYCIETWRPFSVL